MDSEILELLYAEHPGFTESEFDALEYGRHSIYAPRVGLVDVRELVAESYVGRHTQESLSRRRRLPVYVDELVGVPW